MLVVASAALLAATANGVQLDGRSSSPRRLIDTDDLVRLRGGAGLPGSALNQQPIDYRKMTLSQLCAHARTVTESDESVDEALDSPQPRSALLSLVEALETIKLPLSHLCKRARALGISQEKIDQALDGQGDPRRHLITLIAAVERRPLHLIAYATHEQGLLPRLVGNEFGAEVAVLGMGDAWKGYMESKMRAVLDYVKALPADRIVVYLDAFDSLILKDPIQEAALLSAFKALKCEILVSEDPYICGETITKLRFAAGTLHDAAKGAIGHIDAAIKGKLADDESLRCVANAGMFMGYAGSLRRLLETLFAMGYKDDQIALNKAVQADRSIKVDVDHAIFHNMNQTRAGSKEASAVLELSEEGAIATASNDGTPPLARGAFFVSFPFGAAEDFAGWAARVQRDALFHVRGFVTGEK